MSGCSNLDVSRVESVRMNINPEFGMHDGELSSDDDLSVSSSLVDDDSDTRYEQFTTINVKQFVLLFKVSISSLV